MVAVLVLAKLRLCGVSQPFARWALVLSSPTRNAFSFGTWFIYVGLESLFIQSRF